MKRFFKRFAIAFSIYSRIPMPVFVWDDGDTRHAVAFLPLVGLVTGALEFLAYMFFAYMASSYTALPQTAQLMIFILIPLLVTGGFHLDGYLDTSDALSSYKPKEDKLNILKDPHIGAFALISFAKLIILWILGLSLLVYATGTSTEAGSLYLSFAIVFVLGRSLGGMLAKLMPHARKDGMLNVETGEGRIDADLIALIIQTFLCFAVLLYVSPLVMIIYGLVSALEVIIFMGRMKKNFGGVTGDTIGYFIVKVETAMTLALGCLAFLGLVK